MPFSRTNRTLPNSPPTLNFHTIKQILIMCLDKSHRGILSLYKNVLYIIVNMYNIKRRI